MLIICNNNKTQTLEFRIDKDGFGFTWNDYSYRKIPGVYNNQPLLDNLRNTCTSKSFFSHRFNNKPLVAHVYCTQSWQVFNLKIGLPKHEIFSLKA